MNTPKAATWPPKLIVPRTEVCSEGVFGTYVTVWTPEDPFVTHPIEDIAYISEAESTAREKAAEERGRRGAFRIAGDMCRAWCDHTEKRDGPLDLRFYEMAQLSATEEKE